MGIKCPKCYFENPDGTTYCSNCTAPLPSSRAEELLADLKDREESFPIGKKTQPKPQTFVATLIRKKLFFPALLIVLTLIAVVVWQILSQSGIINIQKEKHSLAILYFENVSGDESLEWWCTGLAELLNTDLMQSKFIKVLSGERVYSILKKLNFLDRKKYSTEDLIKIADEGGVSHTIGGSFIKAEENILITVILQKPHTGEVISSLEVKCKKEEEIFLKTDELTRQIKSDMNLSRLQIAGDIDREVGKITTISPDALKHYIEGRRLCLRGEYKSSIEEMEKAVAIDSEFAIAYRSMASSFGDMGEYSAMWNAIQKAFELSNKTSYREYYLIAAAYYSFYEETYNKAIEAYKKVLSLYPEDPTALDNLGWIYYLIEEWDKAEELFLRNIRNGDEGDISYWNLEATYEALGKYDEAHEVISKLAVDFPNQYYFPGTHANLYLFEGEYDRALEELEKAAALHAGIKQQFPLFKGDIHLLKGEFEAAQQQYRKYAEITSAYRYSLAPLFYAQGRFREATEHLQKWPGMEKVLLDLYLRMQCSNEALALMEGLWERMEKRDDKRTKVEFLHRQGLAYVQKKEINRAIEIARKLKILIYSGMNRKLIRYYYNLMGLIKLEQSRPKRAVKFLQKALDLLYRPNSNPNLPFVHAFFYWTLAQAQFEARQWEQARISLEGILGLNSARLRDGDIYAKSFYMLGKIYEQQGDSTKAIVHYEKFLGLWKDADSGIAEVEDAMKKLERFRE